MRDAPAAVEEYSTKWERKRDDEGGKDIDNPKIQSIVLSATEHSSTLRRNSRQETPEWKRLTLLSGLAYVLALCREDQVPSMPANDGPFRTLSKSDFKTARTCQAKLYYRQLSYPRTKDEDEYLAMLAEGG
ncbi:MAG: hypothetical protein ACREA0_22945 [bacterium]